jgi:hypothetical protein
MNPQPPVTRIFIRAFIGVRTYSGAESMGCFGFLVTDGFTAKMDLLKTDT